MLRKKSVLAAKLEATAGTEESVLTADTAYNVFDLDMQPDMEFLDRPGQGAFGQMAGILQARKGTAKFKIELTPGATTTPPLWATVFLPACGLCASTNTYAPVDESPSATSAKPKTITLCRYQDGLKKVLYGAMGNAVFTMTSGNVVMIEFTFTGKWKAVVADVSLLAHTAFTGAPLRFASSSLSVGSFAYKVSQFTLDVGNVVAMREDAADATGFISAHIGDRKPVGTFDAESNLVATKDVYGIWVARTQLALSMSLGDGTNNFAIAAPKLQFTNIQDGDRNGLLIDNISYQLCKSGESGGDEMTLQFS